jgi:hypothetical protein
VVHRDAAALPAVLGMVSVVPSPQCRTEGRVPIDGMDTVEGIK